MYEQLAATDALTDNAIRDLNGISAATQACKLGDRINNLETDLAAAEVSVAALEAATEVVSVRTPLVADSTQRYSFFAPIAGTITAVSSYTTNKAVGVSTAALRRMSSPPRQMLMLVTTPGPIDLTALTDATLEAALLTSVGDHLVVTKGQHLEFAIVAAAGASGCADLAWKVEITPS